MRHPAPLLALLALTIPRLAWAQSALTSGSTAQIGALARLRSNDAVRIHVLGEGWLSRHVIGHHADSLALGSGDRDRTIPAAAIDSVLVRRGHAGAGAVAGALVGLVVGFVVASGAKCPRLLDWGCGTGPPMGGLAIGAVVGVIVGGAARHWERVLPAPS